MTQAAITLPYRRTSPLYIPRRDLVVAASDSIALEVTVVESDNPSAKLLLLTGGLGGPTLDMAIWPDSSRWYCDYRLHTPVAANVLYTASGTKSGSKAGTFDISVPASAVASFPKRCRYALVLSWEGGDHSAMLADGVLHIEHVATAPGGVGSEPLLTDDGRPILA